MSSSSSGPAGHSRNRASTRDAGPHGAATATKTVSYRMPPSSIPADRQLDLLAATVTTCATGRSAAKIRDLTRETGLTRDVTPALRFLTDTGLLTSGPAGWAPTVAGARVGRAWTTDRETARTLLGEAWRDCWVHRLLASSVTPDTPHSVEDIAKAMRPYPTSRLTPWVHLVDWLELAKYVERSDDGTLRLTAPANDTGSSAQESPRESAGAAAPPDPQLGLVLPLSLDQLAQLTAEDYRAVMQSLAAIYDVLARQRS
ncbi:MULTISPECIES: hypothetical protein [unclassified Streptomyces]|uniref:hypothetical protein n=1 Tax=unclassified Streptomyces TaxID=2593676 RepID=UPI001912A687|nr:hypothetical protein [Streptomyces sp. MBT55]MBK6041243.1 hypothetical protein [Streptomyces sp. MBT55]